MVSRGGRSKGCTHCRQRRVKCDEKRPSCGQCVKRKLKCDGPKDLTWIQTFSTDNESAIPAVDSPSREIIPFNTVPQQTPSSRICLPADLSLVAFEPDICLAFARKHLLRGGLVELACDMVDCSENSERFILNPGLGLLRKSILSLAITFFGSRHQRSEIISRGYRQYGQVLKQLNYHLTQPDLQLTNETLLTASSCMLLEIFLPTGPSNFLKHQRGIETIMQLRGPPKEIEEVSATIFRGLRIFSIVGALADSRPSIYTQKEWKQIPPAIMTELGILQHRMFDILADCTHLISKRDAILAAGADPVAVRTLLGEVHALLDNLAACYPEWEILNQNEMANVKEPTKLDNELGVANHVSATVFMLYQAVYMCIVQIKESLCPNPANNIMRNAAAEKIAKCLVIKEKAQRAGAVESNTMGFVATKVVWDALGKFESPEGKQLAHVVKATVNKALSRPYGPLGKVLHESQEVQTQTFDTLVPKIPPSLSMLPISLGKMPEKVSSDDHWPLDECFGNQQQHGFINFTFTPTQQQVQ